MAHGDTMTMPANGRHTRLQDRVPIDEITADARQASPSRAFLGLVGWILFTAGWLVAKIFGILFLSGAWCFSAAKMGWRTARGEALMQPDVRTVLEENARLRAELARVS
jgi:hypothetical protein